MANISTILSNALTVHLRGYLSGLVLSTAGSSATFSVATGVAVDDVQKDFMNLATAISKTTSAWAVGNNNGGIDTGAVANSTWYHVYLIKRPDTGVVDVLFSLSASSPTMPANYTLKRRIGSIRTNGSAQWLLFIQVGDQFLWDVPIQDANAITVSTTAVLTTLSVPTGIQVLAQSSFFANPSTVASAFYLLTSLDVTDTAPSATNFNALGSTNFGCNMALSMRTNTSGQMRSRCSITTGGTVYFNTQGWIDTRGKL